MVYIQFKVYCYITLLYTAMVSIYCAVYIVSVITCSLLNVAVCSLWSKEKCLITLNDDKVTVNLVELQEHSGGRLKLLTDQLRPQINIRARFYRPLIILFSKNTLSYYLELDVQQEHQTSRGAVETEFWMRMSN